MFFDTLFDLLICVCNILSTGALCVIAFSVFKFYTGEKAVVVMEHKSVSGKNDS